MSKAQWEMMSLLVGGVGILLMLLAGAITARKIDPESAAYICIGMGTVFVALGLSMMMVN